MQKTIIVPNHLVEILKQEITSHHFIHLGYDITTLKQYIEKEHSIQFQSSYQIKIQIYKKLKCLSKNNHFYNLITQHEFIDQVYDFVNELKKYQVNFSSIVDTDIKELLALVWEIEFNVDQIYKNIDLLKTDSIYVLEGNYDLFEEIIFEKLGFKVKSLQYFSNELKIPYMLKKQDKQVVQCLNQIQEIEFIAHKIIQDNLDLKEIAIQYTDSSYLPLVQQVFARYNIPYQIKTDSNLILLNQLLKIAFSNYYDSSLFNELLLQYNIFNLEINKLKKLKQYYAIFKTFENTNHLSQMDLSILASEKEWKKNPTEDKVIDFLFSREEFYKMQELENEVSEIYQEIKQIKSNIENCKDIKQYCILMYNYIAKTVKTSEEINLMNQVRKLLQDLSEDIEDEYVFKSIIKWVSDLATPHLSQNGVVVSNIKYNIPFKKIGFILGCDSKSYNQFKLMDGIFNETMNTVWSELKGYPSIKQRYDQYLLHIQNLDYDMIYYTYPKVSFDGKPNELDSYFSKFELEKFELFYQTSIPKRHFELDESIAKSLYLKDKIIETSVTKLQCFNLSPFLFYLRYGLKIKDELEEGYHSLFKGALYHHLLEKYVYKYGKQYALYGQEVVEKDLDFYFNFYRQFFLEKYKEKFELDEYEIKKVLKQSLNQFADIEKEDQFKPKDIEKEYIYTIDEKEYQIRIKGKIDRIDECSEENYKFLKVIDYKSSKKEFDKHRFIRGIDIQLPTYILVSKAESYIILGAFYYSLNTKKEKCINGLNFLSDKNNPMNSFASLFNVKTSTLKELEFNRLISQCELIYKESIKSILSGNISEKLDIEYDYYPYFYLFGKQDNVLKKVYIEWGE